MKSTIPKDSFLFSFICWECKSGHSPQPHYSDCYFERQFLSHFICSTQKSPLGWRFDDRVNLSYYSSSTNQSRIIIRKPLKNTSGEIEMRLSSPVSSSSRGKLCWRKFSQTCHSSFLKNVRSKNWSTITLCLTIIIPNCLCKINFVSPKNFLNSF